MKLFVEARMLKEIVPPEFCSVFVNVSHDPKFGAFFTCDKNMPPVDLATIVTSSMVVKAFSVEPTVTLEIYRTYRFEFAAVPLLDTIFTQGPVVELEAD